MRRLGLRARVTAAFAIGALLLSALMALISYELVRRSLLDERERTALRAAYFDAAVVRAGLDTDAPDVYEVLRTLDTGGSRRALVHRDGRWYARTADEGPSGAVPAGLMAMVADGEPGVQRVRVDGQPALLVGVPLADSTGYYEITSLRELEQTFQVLALALTVVAVTVAGSGAALGWYATRHGLRPLTAVADAAEKIAAGDVTARLAPGTDPDLARLSTSFNRMADQVAVRIERDRRFAADVAHELRSPLQTLSAAASVLSRRRDSLDDRTATAAGLVSEEITRFQQLVNDLIELARSDRPVQRESVDVVALAQGCAGGGGCPSRLSSPARPGRGTGRWTRDVSRSCLSTCWTTRSATAAARSRCGCGSPTESGWWRSTTRAPGCRWPTGKWSSTGSSGAGRPTTGPVGTAPAWGWRWSPSTPPRTAAGPRSATGPAAAPGSGWNCRGADRDRPPAAQGREPVDAALGREPVDAFSGREPAAVSGGVVVGAAAGGGGAGGRRVRGARRRAAQGRRAAVRAAGRPGRK